jgi:hypothetical protein
MRGWLAAGCLVWASSSALISRAARAEALEKADAPLSAEVANDVAPRSPALRVLLENCSGFRDVEVERVLAMELTSDRRLESGNREPTFIIVACSGNQVRLEVHDLLTRKTLQRSFDFGSAIAAARARLIALAAAELVLASWAELAFLPKPQIEPEGDPPNPEAARAAAERVERSRLQAARGASEPIPRPKAPILLLGRDENEAREERGPRGERIVYGDYSWERFPSRTVLYLAALASARTFTDGKGTLLGSGIRLLSDAYPLSAWSVDALLESGTLHPNRETRAHVESFTLGTTLGWPFELGPNLVLRAGGGLRAGLTHARSGGRSANAPVIWGWPLLTAGAAVHLGRASVELSTEAGYGGLPLGPVAPSLQGVWLGAQLGFGFGL